MGEPSSGYHPQPRRDDRSGDALEPGLSSLFVRFVLFVVELRLSQRDRDAFRVNPLVDMSNTQCTRKSLYTTCAESKIPLTQKLQFADFFVATLYAAERKKMWKILRAVH